MIEIIEMIGEMFTTAAITKKGGWMLAGIICLLAVIGYAYFKY